MGHEEDRVHLMSSLEQQILELVKSDPAVGRAIEEILREHGEPPKTYESLSEAKVSFVIPPLPTDFRILEPGTELWIRFWQEYPGQQEEMLRWKSKKTF